MRKIFHIAVLLFIISVNFGCITTDLNEVDFHDSEIVFFTEEILNEFKNNEEVAIEKYKNKRFQVCGEIIQITAPSVTTRTFLGTEKVIVPSSMLLQWNKCWFNFDFSYNIKKEHAFLHEFGYNVKSQYTLERYDTIIIQGTFKNLFKIIGTIYDNKKRLTNPSEEYWEKIEIINFEFRNSIIIEIANN